LLHLKFTSLIKTEGLAEVRVESAKGVISINFIPSHEV
jgi:hypothetical protein